VPAVSKVDRIGFVIECVGHWVVHDTCSYETEITVWILNVDEVTLVKCAFIWKQKCSACLYMCVCVRVGGYKWWLVKGNNNQSHQNL
jgi:hypothetical protein